MDRKILSEKLSQYVMTSVYLLGSDRMAGDERHRPLLTELPSFKNFRLYLKN